MKKQYSSVVFIHDYEDEEVENLLQELREIGDTEQKEHKLFEHLKQWDYGDVGELYTEPLAGQEDISVKIGEYNLSYNTRLGYVGLDKEIFSE